MSILALISIFIIGRDKMIIGLVSVSSILIIILQNIRIYKRVKGLERLIEAIDATEMFKDVENNNWSDSFLRELKEKILDIENVQVKTMIRGSDEKGPTWGREDALLQEGEFRDAIQHGKAYEGMDDELSLTEEMVAEADRRYGEMAQRRWDVAEINDLDLIEEGVEKLGDLVRTDWFERNVEDGAFRAVASPEVDDDSEPHMGAADEMG